MAQSRAALEYRFAQLGRFASGFRSWIYSPSSGLSPAQFVSRLITRHGCQDVLLYLAGGGYATQTAVNIGMGVAAGQILHQDVTLGQLRSLLSSHRGVRFELVLDAPHTGGFHSLSRLPNVLLVATPVAPRGGSFTYLSGASLNGTMVSNDTNPLHLLQLTDRLAFGIDQVIDNPLEVAQMQSLAQAGNLPSALAYLVARAFGLGAAVDFAANSGAGSPPAVQIQGFPLPPSGPPVPPAMPTVTANPDSYSASANAVLNVSAANGVLANDTDSANDPLSVDQLNGVGGTPPLLGTSAEGAAITMNADGSFTYDPTTSATLQALPNGQSTTDTFTYRVNDGHGGTGTATVTITVAGKAHRPPALSGMESSTLQYDAGTPGAAVTSSLAISAPDDTSLTGATVKISSGLVSSEDALSFNAGNGITGSYNPGTGVLTLTGASSVANYQAALRSVTYTDSNGTNPTTGPRTISFQVDDGASSNHLSNTVSRDVQVNPNPPPVAGNVSASTDRNTAIDINVLASDSDPDGDAIHVVSVNTTGTKGLVSINPNGTIHYDPNGQFASLQQGQTATDTFTYQASDGYHDSNSATVTVTVTGVNDPPVLSNIESSTLQYDAGTPTLPVTNTLTVANPHGTTLVGATVTITSGFTPSEDELSFPNQNGIIGSYNASTGVLSLTGTASVADYQAALRSVTYSDPNGTNPTTGPRTVSFQVNDGASSNNLSNVVSRTVQVNPNSPPVAGNVNASTDKHTAIDINVLASDSDPDGDTLSVASVDTAGTLGSVSINPNGTIHYDPNGQFNYLGQGQTATDTFTYTVTDGYHDSNSATVTVTINGVNDQPALSNIETTPLSYRAQDPAVAVTNALTVSDDDDATISSATVSVTSGFDSGADTLSFTNQNGITGSYDASTGVLTLSGNATLPDYQTALRSVEFSTTDSSASPAARTVSFTVTDSVGATSSPASRTIDVAEANQAPVAINQSYNAVGNTPLGVGTNPSSPSVTQSGNVLNGDSDPDSGDPVTLTGTTTPAHGSVSVNPDGTFTYTPAAGFSGTDSFTYTITDTDDPSNPKSATGTVTITVGPVVWYVDNTKPAGNGTSTSPFNTLGAANAAAGAGSIVFLYSGSGDYTGGLTMHPGEDLFGQPHGLTVNGSTLVAASGSNPTITNSGGDGVTVASGDTIEGIDVANSSGNGIIGSNIDGFTLAGSTVSDNGSANTDDGIDFTGLTGTASITNSTITGSANDDASITDTSGSLNLTVTGSTFKNTSASATAGDGLDVFPNGTTNATVSVTGSTFTNNVGNQFLFQTASGSSGSNTLTFSNNALSNPGSLVGGGASIFSNGADNITATVDDNNIQGAAYNAIWLEQDKTAGTVAATIDGNTIGSPGTACSGSSGGSDIGATARGSGTQTLSITNNNLYQYTNVAGIETIADEGSATQNQTITGNTIADPVQPNVTCPGGGISGGGDWGIYDEVGGQTGDTNQVCSDISSNSLTGSGIAAQGGFDVEIDQTASTTARLPGYTGSAFDTSTVQSFIAGNNGGTPSVSATTNNTGGGFVGGSACPTP